MHGKQRFRRPRRLLLIGGPPRCGIGRQHRSGWGFAGLASIEAYGDVLDSSSVDTCVRARATDCRGRDAPVGVRRPGAAHRGAVLVKDIRPGRAGAIQGPTERRCRAPARQRLRHPLLSADDGRHGHELWRSDGTRKGTRMVKDINPGPAGSLFEIIPSSLGTPFYFFADDGVHGAELWRSDGTAAGTSLVKDLFPGPASSLFNRGVGPTHQPRRHPLLLFAGFPNPQNQGLYRSDGTDAGTTLVKKIVNVRALTNFNGTLYFGGAGDDPTFKIGLWRSDGTPAGTTNVKEGVVPSEIVNVNGTMYIDDGYRDLWRSDGTEAGTAMVKDIAPAGAIQDLTAVDGAVYFLASSDCCNSPDELWRSDGTEAGTTIVKHLNVEPGYGFDLAAFKGKLYFTAGGWLWRSDGTPQGTTSSKATARPKRGPHEMLQRPDGDWPQRHALSRGE